MRYLTDGEIEARESLRLWIDSGAAPPPVGGDDPAPCGSGKKFKEFCLNRAGRQALSST